MEPEQQNKKKVIGEALKRLGVIDDKDAGQIIVHINNGGVTRIIKQAEVK